MLPARDTELVGTATDFYPIPGGVAVTTWSLVSSPGNVASDATIATPNALVTAVTVDGTAGVLDDVRRVIGVSRVEGAGSEHVPSPISPSPNPRHYR